MLWLRSQQTKDRKVKHKVGSACVIQASERIEEAAEKMEWRKVEVAKVFPYDATITQAETIAAVEAARAICCLVQTGQIIFDLEGNLIDEWTKTLKGLKTGWKRTLKRETQKKLDDENFVSATDISHSDSASLPAVIWASISAKEMTSSRYFKLGARTTRALPAPTQPCPNCGDPTIPPWRDKSLWTITTTEIVGLLTEDPSSGSKKKMEELCEMMKKHAMENAKLWQEHEEGKQRYLESEKWSEWRSWAEGSRIEDQDWRDPSTDERDE